jgi:hypothetical protein
MVGSWQRCPRIGQTQAVSADVIDRGIAVENETIMRDPLRWESESVPDPFVLPCPFFLPPSDFAAIVDETNRSAILQRSAQHATIR